MKEKNANAWFKRPVMQTVIPEGKAQTAEVQHFTLTPESQTIDSLRHIIHGMSFMCCKPGNYVRIVADGKLQMSDSDMEWRTNTDFLLNAHGDVLIAGLGIGFVIVPLLLKPEVNSIRVVEKNPDVIALVAPHLKHKKLRVDNGDINTYRNQLNGDRFNTIYFDIWHDLCTDNAEHMKRLHRQYRKYMRPNGYMNSWTRDIMPLLRARGF